MINLLPATDERTTILPLLLCSSFNALDARRTYDRKLIFITFSRSVIFSAVDSHGPSEGGVM